MKLYDLLGQLVRLVMVIFILATMFVVVGFAAVFIGPLVNFGLELGQSTVEWLGLSI